MNIIIWKEELNNLSITLDEIQDFDHAYAVVTAYERHNETDYDDLLRDGYEMAKAGLISHDEIKNYARGNMRKS